MFLPGFTPSGRGRIGSPHFIGHSDPSWVYNRNNSLLLHAKSAILSLSGVVTSVPVHLPCGLVVSVPVFGLAGNASCKKFAGDYPGDVTAGCEFIAEAMPLPDGIRFVPGEGIGRFSRDTPRFRKGEPAISSAPLECILTSIQEATDQQGLSGVRVKLQIPLGAEIAKKTLNPKVGVEGGLSVLVLPVLLNPGMIISKNQYANACPHPTMQFSLPVASVSGTHASCIRIAISFLSAVKLVKHSMQPKGM